MRKNHLLTYVVFGLIFWGQSVFAVSIPPQTDPWYETILATLIDRASALWTSTSTRAMESLIHYESVISPKIEPLRTWYEANNVNVNIIPSLMTVHILDFVLIVLAIFLFGWFVLKSLA